MDVKSSAIRSVKWTIFGEIISRSITPILFLVLARILTPNDFGTIGAAMVVIGFVSIFQEFGLGRALIQHEGEIDKSADVIFWTNMGLSVFLYLILFITSPLISDFFHEPKLVNVLRVLCIQLILFGLISVHQSLFQRKFQFKQLFFIKLFSSLVPGSISIPFALLGYGVWALACGTLAGTAIQLILIWKASPWRPRLRYDFRLSKQLLKFGGWVTMEGLLGWLMVWGDSAILGHYLGVKELGIYRTGVMFLSLISGLILNPIFPVVYSSFSRLQSDMPQLRNYYLKVTQLIASIALPVCITIALLAKPISLVIFGGKWVGIEIVIFITVIKDLFSLIAVGISVETLKAIGRPDINVKLYALSAIYFIPVYILSAPYGLLVFCVGRFLTSVVTILMYVFTISRLIKITPIYPLACAKTSLITVSIMGAFLWLFKHFISIAGWFELAFAVILAALIYILVFRLTDASTFRATLGYIHRVLRPSKVIG